VAMMRASSAMTHMREAASHLRPLIEEVDGVSEHRSIGA
jgi:hypothetical protein